MDTHRLLLQFLAFRVLHREFTHWLRVPILSTYLSLITAQINSNSHSIRLGTHVHVHVICTCTCTVHVHDDLINKVLYNVFAHGV